MENQLYTIPSNCDFEKIYNGVADKNECSPKLKNKFSSEFEGILVNGPLNTIWSNNETSDNFPIGPWGETDGPLRLMIAGLVRAPYKTLGLNGDFSDEVLLVAVDINTAKTYTGKMPQAEFLPVPEDDQPQRTRSQAEKDALVTCYFNLDLVADLGLPIADANYHVYATLGEYKSDVLTIKTNVKK